MSKQIVFSLGGNVGNVADTFNKAIELLTNIIGDLTKKSSIYVTKAWGVENQPDFLNQVIIFDTQLEVLVILKNCLSIELDLGRDRKQQIKWEKRPIDIDILFYGEEIINTPNLIVPHPFIQDRNFILAPLNEIIPDYKHPILNKTIKMLHANCKDKLEVIKK